MRVHHFGWTSVQALVNRVRIGSGEREDQVEAAAPLVLSSRLQQYLLVLPVLQSGRGFLFEIHVTEIYVAVLVAATHAAHS